MRGSRLPQVLKNTQNDSITLSHGKSKYSLLWLHGLGDQAASYLPFFGHLQSPLYSQTRLRLLQAPTRFVSLNHQSSPAWFDLKAQHRLVLPQSQAFDLLQLDHSKELIQQYCKQEEQFWAEKEPQGKVNPQHRIFVGGYGQGAIAALHYGLESEQIPAGLIAVDGCLLRHTQVKNIGKIPILLLQNQKGGMLSETEARSSYSKIMDKSQLANSEQYSSDEGHLSINQLKTMRKWMEQTFTFIEEHYQGPKEQFSQH